MGSGFFVYSAQPMGSLHWPPQRSAWPLQGRRGLGRSAGRTRVGCSRAPLLGPGLHTMRKISIRRLFVESGGNRRRSREAHHRATA